MGEFFKGWRRKAGLVMLAVACGLSLAWLRSYEKNDRIDGLIAARSVHGYFVSTNGDMNIIRRFPLPPDDAFNSLHLKNWISWRAVNAQPTHPVLLGRAAAYEEQSGAGQLDCWSEFTVAWRFDFAGFHCGEGRHRSWESWDVQLWTFPYWSITLPMALLSAYLILWKPRKAKGMP